MTLTRVHSGKVRDIYDAGEDRLLMVASDRISAFDVVMGEPIPEKGRVLTAMTVFWMQHLSDLAPNHLISTDQRDFPEGAPDELTGRATLVHRAEMLPLECIVRGRLSGTAWKEYRASGTMHGDPLPEGLLESAILPEPCFTPSTKADVGHDVNISFQDAVSMVGAKAAEAARDISVAAYSRGVSWAARRGIVIADTKFELGFIDGQLCLCDEVLTPDSSRFWPAREVTLGSTPPSFDKQPLRDWLEGTGWDKAPPPPLLPPDVVEATASRYISAYEKLSGLSLGDWPGASG
ncbi:MAG: phosphoribosylaminoimidazolesuccinocarboxamide synthase [Acidimicrobiales bacterium]